MLHGCTQTAAAFAAATRITALADREGFVVVLPEQDAKANRQRCWNWFRPRDQVRDGGEPARIVAACRAVGGQAIDPGRVYAAGLSAGGAMAAVLAVTHPDVFAAVAVHSGVPYGSAHGAVGAFGVMARGVRHPERLPAAGPIPHLVLHGLGDGTVSAANARQIADPGTPPTRVERGRVPGGHAWTRAVWEDELGAPRHELLEVEGMGHAWSGGLPGTEHTDPRGPDATAAAWDFFARVSRSARPAPR
jgi:poly(hydroxyalkanoate) depolymerase family esterase